MEKITLKTTKKMAAIDLLNWIDDNGVKDVIATSKSNGKIRVHEDGEISTYGKFSVNDFYEMEIKREIDEYSFLRKVLIKSVSGYEEERHARIADIKDKTERLLAIYTINSDDTMTLVYESERGLVQEG